MFSCSRMKCDEEIVQLLRSDDYRCPGYLLFPRKTSWREWQQSLCSFVFLLCLGFKKSSKSLSSKATNLTAFFITIFVAIFPMDVWLNSLEKVRCLHKWKHDIALAQWMIDVITVQHYFCSIALNQSERDIFAEGIIMANDIISLVLACNIMYSFK